MANNLESVFNSASTRDGTKLSKHETHLEQSPHTIGEHNYTAIAESHEFKSLKSKKNKFILPMSIFFLLAYIMLPILTSYTNILNANAFGDVAWVWIYSLALFVMTWAFCMIYVKKANSFDKEVEVIFEKEKAGGYK